MQIIDYHSFFTVDFSLCLFCKCREHFVLSTCRPDLDTGPVRFNAQYTINNALFVRRVVCGGAVGGFAIPNLSSKLNRRNGDRYHVTGTELYRLQQTNQVLLTRE